MKTNCRIRKLGELCHFVRGPFGGNLKKSCFMTTGIAVYEQQHAIYDQFNEFRYFIDKNKFQEMQRFEVAPGDLIMSCSGTMGKVAIVPDNAPKGIINQALLKLSPYPGLDVRYLKLWMESQSFQTQLAKYSLGAAINNVASVKTLKKIDVPLPSVSEQKRIVRVIDDISDNLNKANENAEKNLANARELFESYLNNVFANPGADWEEKKLGDIGKVSMCKRVFKDQTTTTGEIPFYKIGTFGKEPDAYISKEIYDKYRKKFSFPKKGDILISASGTIGRRVKYDGEPAYFQDSNIVWIDNYENQVLNEYLYHFYGACNWDSTKGATISRLYNDNLKQIKITFSKSLTEQRSIVAKLDALSAETKKLEEIYKKKLENLEQLKKSILHKAFNGELTGAN